MSDQMEDVSAVATATDSAAATAPPPPAVVAAPLVSAPLLSPPPSASALVSSVTPLSVPLTAQHIYEQQQAAAAVAAAYAAGTIGMHDPSQHMSAAAAAAAFQPAGATAASKKKGTTATGKPRKKKDDGAPASSRKRKNAAGAEGEDGDAAASGDPSDPSAAAASSSSGAPAATGGCRYDSSLGLLTKKFVTLLQEASNQGVLDLNQAAQKLGVQKRRIYDITNVLEGIGLISKKSKNNIQWRGSGLGPMIDMRRDLLNLKTELETLSSEESDLDDLIRHMQETISSTQEQESNAQHCYMTHEDVRRVELFQNKILIAVKAPKGTTLNVPDPMEEQKRERETSKSGGKMHDTTIQPSYQCILKSSGGPIDVYVVSNHEPNSSIGADGQEYASIPPSASTSPLHPPPLSPVISSQSASASGAHHHHSSGHAHHHHHHAHQLPNGVNASIGLGSSVPNSPFTGGTIHASSAASPFHLQLSSPSMPSHPSLYQTAASSTSMFQNAAAAVSSSPSPSPLPHLLAADHSPHPALPSQSHTHHASGLPSLSNSRLNSPALHRHSDNTLAMHQRYNAFNSTSAANLSPFPAHASPYRSTALHPQSHSPFGVTHHQHHLAHNTPQHASMHSAVGSSPSASSPLIKLEPSLLAAANDGESDGFGFFSTDAEQDEGLGDLYDNSATNQAAANNTSTSQTSTTEQDPDSIFSRI